MISFFIALVLLDHFHRDGVAGELGGGAGAGVSVQPVGFLLVGNNDIRFQVVDHNAIYDRLIDEVPQMVEKLAGHKKETQKENLAEQMVQVLQDSMQDK